MQKIQYEKDKNEIDLEQNRICPGFIYVQGGGRGEPSICTEIGFSAHFLCVRGFPSSQVIYKLIIEF